MIRFAGLEFRVVAAGTRIISVVTGEQALVSDASAVRDGNRLYVTETLYQMVLAESLRLSPVAGAS